MGILRDAIVKEDYFEGFLWWKKLVAPKGKKVIIVEETKFHNTVILVPEEKFAVIPSKFLA